MKLTPAALQTHSACSIRPHQATAATLRRLIAAATRSRGICLCSALSTSIVSPIPLSILPNILCLYLCSCQHAGSANPQDSDVINAPAGGYGRYLNGCPNPSNGSLVARIQQQDVCSQQLDLRQMLYTTPWLDTGDWCVRRMHAAACAQLTPWQGTIQTFVEISTPNSLAIRAKT
jgi:hypothetical protein